MIAEETLDPAEYLENGVYIDTDAIIVQKTAKYFAGKFPEPLALAQALFYYVRDAFKYSITFDLFSTDVFKASYCLSKKTSFCMPKAASLCALARAIGIPARLHFADLRNQRIPPHLFEILKTDTFYFHCYAELHLDDKWVKATPSFDLQTCLKHDLPPVEFDGSSDGLFAALDSQGRPYCSYVKDRGVYSDIPMPVVLEGLKQYYGDLKSFFLRKHDG